MKALLFLILAAFLTCTSTVRAESVGELTTRLNRLESALKKVQKNLSNNYVGSKKATAGDAEEAADAAFMQAQGLEESVRDLTGEVETFRFKQDKLTERVNKINEDVNLRFKGLEEKISKLQESLNKLTEAERKAAAAKEKEIAKEKAQAKAEENKTAGIKKEFGKMKPNDLYKNAFSALKKNDYKNAERQFEAFTILFPKHKLAGNAQYWMGESFYARGNYEQAAVAFADGFKMFRDSQKAPDNLLKLGLTMARLNKKKEACIAFKNFSKEYPKVSDAMKKRLEKEAAKVGCK